MLGLMQDQPLMITSIIRHAARHHGGAEVVSKTVEGAIHRTTYAEVERRSRRLVRVLQRLGVATGERVATLAWNGFRHLELYYAVSGMQAICHTINPRLSPDDIAYIVNDAQDVVIFADTSFAGLLAGVAPRVRASVRAVVFMTEPAHMPDIALPEGMDLLCYEDLMAAADEDYAWPVFDERVAASLCYTSGTTGKPKGVLYSHRSTLLHALAVNMPDVLAMRAVDRMLPVVPMFHVNAWGTPYAAPMAGASLVMPGRHLDGASLRELMNAERVTISAGVPTVWLGLLQHLRASGTRLETVERLVIGGSACPRMLMEAFHDEYGVRVDHAWGMTELSPVGTFNRPKAGNADLGRADMFRLHEKQGRALFGVDMRIVDDAGHELPWDGSASGHLQVKGPWVCSAYYGGTPGDALDAEGWFTTGDVATIDADGYMEITDRSKDVIKSGGEWISSIQLENIAVSHPAVAEAAIVAARHPKWDERPLLIVVAKQDQTIDKDELLAIYRGKVADWWRPDDVVVVEELPHTATGKVHKLTLRDRFRDYLVSKAG
ncbi:3-(methylthio)propionyl-CoA ligase [Limobrevibacterium gyesilva]|uniref:3-methylmercaptopropionyl-CoA ligase n=1 Tax=Limobrevibacterium gyesilva TaxID=2991712 RepID=A0AA41YJF1_9PROT|nr:3-(methylthio)propionyl-CoA ligase [Limobrevibacterium gyesilva]MCW3474294.1 3-(methylthio)propionyl-CoA ligase [Limobrevibacterium gyesilva]